MGTTCAWQGIAEIPWFAEAVEGSPKHWFWNCDKCDLYGMQSLDEYRTKCTRCGGPVINMEAKP